MMRKTVFILFGAAIIGGAILFAAARTAKREIIPDIMKTLDSNEAQSDRAPLAPLADPLIVVKKSARKLHLYDGEQLVATYNIGLGFAPVGDKERQGDGKTPEGEFYIFTKNPQSSYYLSLGVSYPGADDAERGLREKLITRSQHDAILRANRERKMPPQKTRLGGEIYIHGNGSARDWTWGCVALDDADMKELFDSVAVGARVRIEP